MTMATQADIDRLRVVDRSGPLSGAEMMLAYRYLVTAGWVGADGRLTERGQAILTAGREIEKLME